jgi:hypothetical protein
MRISKKELKALNGSLEHWEQNINKLIKAQNTGVLIDNTNSINKKIILTNSETIYYNAKYCNCCKEYFTISRECDNCPIAKHSLACNRESDWANFAKYISDECNRGQSYLKITDRLIKLAKNIRNDIFMVKEEVIKEMDSKKVKRPYNTAEEFEKWSDGKKIVLGDEYGNTTWGDEEFLVVTSKVLNGSFEAIDEKFKKVSWSLTFYSHKFWQEYKER